MSRAWHFTEKKTLKTAGICLLNALVKSTTIWTTIFFSITTQIENYKLSSTFDTSVKILNIYLFLKKEKKTSKKIKQLSMVNGVENTLFLYIWWNWLRLKNSLEMYVDKLHLFVCKRGADKLPRIGLLFNSLLFSQMWC